MQAWFDTILLIFDDYAKALHTKQIPGAAILFENSLKTKSTRLWRVLYDLYTSAV
jgi:hypothetical protein